MSLLEFVDSARISAASAQMAYERAILERAIKTVRTTAETSASVKRLFTANPACTAARVQEWWRRLGGIPRHLPFLDIAIQHDLQPVLCNISIAAWGTRGTVLVPVPMRIGDKQDFCDIIRKAIWVNYPVEVNGESPERSILGINGEQSSFDSHEAIRLYSHALLNISQGVRLWDRPCLGYVAAAHQLPRGKVLYIPDVAKVPAKGATVNELGVRVVSSAREEEQFLGLSSVLYIPIAFEAPLDSNDPNGEAYAVLMLWSPVPNRWSHLYEGNDAVIVQSDIALNEACITHFEWLQDHLMKDRADNETREVSLLSMIENLLLWAGGATRTRLDEFENRLHGLGVLFRYLTGNYTETKTPSDVDWLKFQFMDSDGLIKQLAFFFKSRLGSLPLRLCVRNELVGGEEADIEKSGELKHIEESNFWQYIPVNMALTVPDNVANGLATREAKNLKAYAAGLDRVDIDLSDQFLTLRLWERPNPQTLLDLTQCSNNYWRYFALRRGIPIARRESQRTTGGGIGIGLAMFSALARHARMYRTVYCSPAGDVIWSELALPHTRVPQSGD